MLCDRRLESLNELLNFYKDGSCLFFISEWFDDSRIVEELLED